MGPARLSWPEHTTVSRTIQTRARLDVNPPRSVVEVKRDGKRLEKTYALQETPMLGIFG